MERTELRTSVAEVEQKLAALSAAHSPTEADLTALRASFSRVVAQLALGPEPETRACPTCGKRIMRDATRCMHCWAKSSSTR